MFAPVIFSIIITALQALKARTIHTRKSLISSCQKIIDKFLKAPEELDVAPAPGKLVQHSPEWGVIC